MVKQLLALWHRGDGLDRYTGIVNRVLLPGDDDRDLHGNVTVRGRYLNRAVDQAVQSEAGVAVLHSHPASGWQAMSGMDDRTERRIIAPLVRETGLPLLGLTMGMDECWSARFWQEPELGRIVPAHCTDVRRVGTRHSRADWAPGAYPAYHRRRRLRRTLDSWGIEAQARLARTHVCVVRVGYFGLASSDPTVRVLASIRGVLVKQPSRKIGVPRRFRERSSTVSRRETFAAIPTTEKNSARSSSYRVAVRQVA